MWRTGWELGQSAKEQQRYQLFDNKNDTADSLYTQHHDYVLFFDDLIRGLQPRAPVEFRGIRLGTVAEVPFATVSADQEMNGDYRVPVLIRIEPDRFISKVGKNFDINKRLTEAEVQGFRAALKSANLLTGALYVDLDFYPQAKAWPGPSTVNGYPVLPTTSAGLAQIQQKLTATLDKINALPLDSMLTSLRFTPTTALGVGSFGSRRYRWRIFWPATDWSIKPATCSTSRPAAICGPVRWNSSLQQSLVANLSAALPGTLVSTQPIGSSGDSDQLAVTVTGFHGRYDGRAVVQGCGF